MIRMRPPWIIAVAWRAAALLETPVTVLFDRIETLLDEPHCGEDEPTLERLESTLTDGYAQALQLESDRMKIERRISEVAGSSAAADAKVEELASLTRRLSTTGRELDRLRQLLATLRMRARAVRDRISPQHSLQA
jgi:chromosome segregation ATPase